MLLNPFRIWIRILDCPSVVWLNTSRHYTLNLTYGLPKIFSLNSLFFFLIWRKLLFVSLPPTVPFTPVFYCVFLLDYKMWHKRKKTERVGRTVFHHYKLISVRIMVYGQTCPRFCFLSCEGKPCSREIHQGLYKTPLSGWFKEQR